MFRFGNINNSSIGSIILLISLTLSGCGSSTPIPQKESLENLKLDTITIVSANIGSATHTSPYISPQIALTQIGDLFAKINNKGVVYAGLQEVDNGRARSGEVNQSSTLKRHLKFKKSLFSATLGGYYGIATLLSHNGVTKAYDLGCYDVPARDSEKRVVQITKFKLKGRPLWLLNTHLSYVETKALCQSNNMVKIIRKHIPADEDIIITGDFNLRKSRAEHDTLSANMLSVGLKEVVNTKQTFPATSPGRIIDYIFIRDLRNCFSQASALEVFSPQLSAGGTYLSDHRFLQVDIKNICNN